MTAKNIILSAAILASALYLLSGCTVTQGGNKRWQISGREFSGSLTRELSDGVYEGSAQGYRGSIHVRLQIEGGSITEIDIVDSAEDWFVGDEAMEELLELVLIYNSPDLDAISGATESSEGFLAAVIDALEKARTNAE